MPPRFAYWTILAGGLPTSFRAADKDELMPTFNRLKEKHPDAEMKYFARGKLWDSADDARRALAESNRAAARRPDSRRGDDRERRGRDWRPGGEHRDPRQRFKDAKRARNQDRRQQRWIRANDGQRSRPGDAPVTRPHGDPLSPQRGHGPAARGSRHGNQAAKGPHRPFKPTGHRRFERSQEPPRPPRPDGDPPPRREPPPGPPPRPSEPEIKPPGPPERGHRTRDTSNRRKRKREE